VTFSPNNENWANVQSCGGLSSPEVLCAGTGVVAVALVVLALLPPSGARSVLVRRAPLRHGRVSLSRDGTPVAKQPAYRAVKNKNHVPGAPKFSIPVPFGLIKFLKDHPINQLRSDRMFDPKSPAFNPWRC